MTDLFSSTVVLQQEFTGKVLVDKPLPGIKCCFDIYYPAVTDSSPPVVLIVTGFPDYGRKQESGKGLKDLPPYLSWGRLLASEGIATVIASCSDPAQDLSALIQHLTAEQDHLKLDMQRLALWTCSGNGPTAIHLLGKYPEVRAGVLLYAYTVDLGEHDVVSTTARKFGFCNPETNKDLLIESTPLFIVRAGKDEFAGLNESMDRWVSALQARNSHVEFIDYEEGLHGFDLIDSSAESLQVIRRLLDYLKERLSN